MILVYIKASKKGKKHECESSLLSHVDYLSSLSKLHVKIGKI